MQAERYTMADAQNGRTPRAYVQDIIRHAKAAEFSSVYNQLTMAWNNLELDFRAHIPEPKLNTTLSIFLESLDEKANIWQQIAAKRANLSGPKSGSSRNNRQISKQTCRQGRQDGFRPTVATPLLLLRAGLPISSGIPSTRALLTHITRTTSLASLQGIKQPLLLKPANASDSKNQQRSRPRQNAGGRNSGNGRFENRGSGGKARAYVANEDEEDL